MRDIGRLKSLGTVVVLTDEYVDYPKLVVDNIASVLNDAGYGTLCVSGRELVESTSFHRYAVCNEIYKLVELSDIQGLISITGSIGHRIDSSALAAFLNRYNVPKVSLGIGVSEIPSVVIDDQSGMKQLMDHLLQDDNRQVFAFVRGYPNDPYSLKREQIFRKVLEEHGREVDESLFVEGNYDSFEAYGAVAELLETNSDIDAVVAANDLMALSAARAISAKGLEIPQDIAVAGFDDTREATQHSPALTTVRQSIGKLVHSTVELLLAAVENSPVSSGSDIADKAPEIRVHNELVARGSTLSESSDSIVQEIYSSEGLGKWLQLAMSGLVKPPDANIQEVADVYWQTAKTGSQELSDYFDKMVSSSVVFEHIHWWSNLCYQLEQHATQILNLQPERGALILASLSKVRERVWSVSLDREFELHRLENAQTRMQLQMSSCTDFNEILIVFANWLSTLGVFRSFLVRFDEPAPTPGTWSQLIHVFRKGEVEPCLDEHFHSKDLLPISLRNELRHGLLIMCPLFAGKDLFGYLLLDPVGLVNLDLESTASSIGNAMRNQYLIETLEKQASSLQVANQELYTLAQYDSLTGLPSRLNFQHRLQDQCKLSAQANTRFALLFIDLDGFKLINDTFGHDAGDYLLQAVSERLQDMIAQSDMSGVFIARLGGDEFTVIVDLKDTSIDVVKFNQKIVEALSKSFSLQGQAFSVSGSVGCAFFPDDGTDAKLLVKHADTAMYHAKNRGKNCMAFFDAEMSETDSKFLQLDQEMRLGIQNDEFSMYFQPRVDLASGKICGVEALMRWIVDTPDGPQVHSNPDEFIKIAESTGFITQLDLFALDQACRVARRWEVAGVPLPVAVNLSVVLLQTATIVDTVKAIIDQYELDPNLLELEITESAVMSEVESNVAKLTKLRDMGIRISIDDFGTGYSSLSYLKKLPINYLKIDRSFIVDVISADENETVDAAIIRSVVALGKSMDLELVAEGVETQAQVDLVTRMGCDQAQGYFFARPQPLQELEVLLSDTHQSRKVA